MAFVIEEGRPLPHDTEDLVDGIEVAWRKHRGNESNPLPCCSPSSSGYGPALRGTGNNRTRRRVVDIEFATDG
jgi:hypothetical protein